MISKNDWKLFREKLPEWQEKYMEKLINEYVIFLRQEDKVASDKFWELEKRIKKDRKNPGVIMELNKPEATWDIANLIRHKVILVDDLSHFSEELQQDVKRILDVN
ncbi:hypothetical protein SAMN02745111_02381 [Eubacterium uniforme]|uniref:Multidrug transporter n=1 Tax=Eubacterium uniforme TaxID=39495 RepID=A0A1T4W5J8_9FIRM|nr:hypothetical protein [Eubacterium uniforme]SKA72594.1 hypothetical protein SAMN02745111_02381 [Eubacterium uniforme]